MNDPDAMKTETLKRVHIQSYLWYYFILFINYPLLIRDFFFFISTNFLWNNFQSMAVSLHMQFIWKKLLLVVSDLSWLYTNILYTLVFQSQLMWSAKNYRDYSGHLFPERAQKFPIAGMLQSQYFQKTGFCTVSCCTGNIGNPESWW